MSKYYLFVSLVFYYQLNFTLKLTMDQQWIKGGHWEVID